MCENVVEFKTKEELLKESKILYVIIATKNNLWYAISTLQDFKNMEDADRDAILEYKEGIPLFPTKELCLTNVRTEAIPFENLGITVKVYTTLNQEL